MILNIGCGEFYQVGWTNIDIAQNDQVKPDYVCSVLDLHEDLVDLELVYCGHVLEHLKFEDVAIALTNIRERMTDGATIMCVGPDCVRAKAMLESAQINQEEYRSICEGADRWGGDHHWWECDEDKLFTALTDAGFQSVTRVPITDPELSSRFPLVSVIGWQCAVSAVK